jgi:hypothetical protein
MLTHKLKVAFTDKGFLISLVTSLLVLVWFYGDILLHINSVFFWYKGDAIQVYYNSLYHVMYDKSLIQQDSMNYPYSENVFFTGCMPLITGFIKLTGLRYFTVGIINLSMLLSLPLCSLFIYLIFREYKLNYIFSAFASVAITYLNPQVMRLGGHFNLTYFFAIPAAMWLMIRFIKKPGYKTSLVIAALCFFLACTHLYLYIFVVALLLFGWLYLLFNLKPKQGLALFLPHGAIQILLPFIILQLLVLSANYNTDRTALPWGFFEYTSNLYGIFYPLDRFYETLFKQLEFTGQVNYEGQAYVGICATLLCIFLILKLCFNLLTFRYKRLLMFTDKPVLNYFIVCAILCLLFSFCIPFKFTTALQEMVYKIGFLKQFRAIGRFTWVFYYVINIALVFVVCSIPEKYNKYYFKSSLMAFIIFFLSYDAYCNMKQYENTFNNRIYAITDFKNKFAENSWVKLIDNTSYQAILPFPYFHIGSENLNINAGDEILKQSCIVSLKTGLPMISVFLSRTSTGQTYKNVQLLKEPTGKVPDILNDFKNEKDILIVSLDNACNNYEKEILSRATLITQTSSFSLYRIPFQSFKNYYRDYPKPILTHYDDSKLFSYNNYTSNMPVKDFTCIGFENANSEFGFKTPGVRKGPVKNYMNLFDMDLVNPNQNKDFVLSFWVKDLKRDLFPRTKIALAMTTKNFDVYYPLPPSADLSYYFTQIDGDWTLVEINLQINPTDRHIKLDLWNDALIHNEELTVDDVLLRPAATDVYFANNGYLLKNNRIYYK